MTLISISIVMIVVVVSKNNTMKKIDEATPEQLRVIQLNNFLNNLQESYIERSLYISSRRALTSLALYILKTNSLLDILNPKFSEVVMSGKIDGIDIDSITGESLMENNTLQYWISEIENVTTDSLRSRLNITINSVGIYQSSPWIINAVTNVSINLTDASSNWTIDGLIISTDLDVSDFQDPLFLYKFGGVYNHTMKRSDVKPDNWNAALLNEHIKNGTYVYWGDDKAPSFLMRFTQNVIASNIFSECCGIESIVDGEQASKAGAGGIKHSVDYLFFRGIDCDDTKLFSIGTVDLAHQPVYFDAENVAKYKINPEEASNACPEQQGT